MSKRNTLSTASPLEVEQALKALGANLRTARLARNLSIEQAAAKIGVGYRTVAAAEAGKPGTAVSVHLSLLWIYDLLGQIHDVADPLRDPLVQRATRTRARAYPTHRGALDNDF
jgi:transcriptional regulator with XRE-family HTH domain